MSTEAGWAGHLDRPSTMRPMSSRLRVLLVLAGAFAFGLVAAWAKGQNTDGLSTISQVRGDLGNLSSPWLLVPFIAGARSRRPGSGALLGFAATMSALLGFYLLTSLVVDAGGRGIVGDFGRELRANRVYLESGVLSGPLFGALGAWWGKTRSLGASVVAGALMMGEPIVLASVGVLLPWAAVGRNAISVGVYGTEFALGLVVLLVARSRPSATVRDAR
jgi:hypothetical protein